MLRDAGLELLGPALLFLALSDPEDCGKVSGQITGLEPWLVAIQVPLCACVHLVWTRPAVVLAPLAGRWDCC